MNLAEKLAVTYLRLNGFLLLPHFTVFDGEQHNHVDLIGFRLGGSREQVGAAVFPTDDVLFGELTSLHGADARLNNVGIVAEVRTNDDRNTPSPAHVAYVQQFLGGSAVCRLAFHRGERRIQRVDGGLDIGTRYAGLWIQERIDAMAGLRLTKGGSWNWSESFLADFLALRESGLLTDERNGR